MRFDNTFSAIIKHDVINNIVPFLKGQPGIGKSSFITKFFEDTFDSKCFTLNCNTLATKEDLTGVRTVPVLDEFGHTVADEYTQKFFPAEAVRVAIKYAEDNPDKTCGLFLDEINRTPSDLTSALLTAVTARTVGDKRLPDNLAIICAGNDEGNVTALDEASLSRFSIYSLEPDAVTFLGLDDSLNEAIVEVLTEHPDAIFTKKNLNSTDDNESDIDDFLDDEVKLENFTTPRTITYLSNWLNSVDMDFLSTLMSAKSDANRTQLKEVLVAHTGNTEFTTYLYSKLTERIRAARMKANGDDYSDMLEKPNAYIDAVAASEDKDKPEDKDFAIGQKIWLFSVDELLDTLAYAMSNSAVSEDMARDKDERVNASILKYCATRLMAKLHDKNNTPAQFSHLSLMQRVLESDDLNEKNYEHVCTLMGNSPESKTFIERLNMLRG